MTHSASDLPIYKNPPVDEVVIGVQFDPIPGFYDVHTGLFWQRVREDYPKVEDQPRLPDLPIESLDSPVGLIQVQLPLATPHGRIWLASESDEYLIQIQNNRFLHNWRKRQADYPRFATLRQLFWNHYGQFKDLMVAEGLSPPRVQQVELSYINWIPNISMVELLRLAQATRLSVPGLSAEPQEQTWLARYFLKNDSDAVARIYVQCTPALKIQDPNARGIQLSLVFRAARASGVNDEEVNSLVTVGREALVRTFTELTTETAQQSWDRIR